MALPGKYVLPLFFLVLFFGAIILGPLLYFALGAVWPIPFHRAMDRALLISAVAALALFWPRIPLRELWPWNGDAWKQALLGLIMAAVSLQAIIGLYAALAGFTSSHLEGGKAAGRIAMALVAAILVAPLEETVFRGFIQRELARSVGWRGGWLIAAAIYMLAHFLKIPEQFDHEPVHLWSGATALGAAFLPVLHGAFLDGKGINLLLIGLILGGIFLRAGSLWVNAGLHAGWIFGLLIFTGFTRPIEPSHVSWAGGDILSSPVTTLVLLLSGLWLWRFYRNPSVLPETGDNAP
jgi:membrane protease YdiL (CAAX protease family)